MTRKKGCMCLEQTQYFKVHFQSSAILIHRCRTNRCRGQLCRPGSDPGPWPQLCRPVWSVASELLYPMPWQLILFTAAGPAFSCLWVWLCVFVVVLLTEHFYEFGLVVGWRRLVLVCLVITVTFIDYIDWDTWFFTHQNLWLPMKAIPRLEALGIVGHLSPY